MNQKVYLLLQGQPDKYYCNYSLERKDCQEAYRSASATVDYSLYLSEGAEI